MGYNLHFIKEPNHVDVDISARVKNKIETANNSKMVRNIAFKILIEDGLIPPHAKLGWLGNPDRRTGCSAKHHAYLDGLNRLFSVAKYHFGEDCKELNDPTRNPNEDNDSIKITGTINGSGAGYFLLDFTGVPNTEEIHDFLRQNKDRIVEFTVTQVTDAHF